MALVSDYFLLYHGVHFDVTQVQHTLDFANTEEETLRSFALLLMISRKSFDRFSALGSFKPLCQDLNLPKPKDLSELQLLQYSIIQNLANKHCSAEYKTLQETFVYLLDEALLQKENYKKLMSLFSYHAEEKDVDTAVTSVFSFPAEKQRILENITVLKTLTEDAECCDDIKEFLQTQKFSIGITGVMNAGKSTMINALMGKKILGTSVVPETANLTLLQYSQTPSAKVIYWNQREWQNIVQASSQLAAMKDFVEETTSAFTHDLHIYILERSKEEEIRIEALPLYTSAEHSGKKCNLVKNVLLKTDLSFLKNGVEIVDTPGLDDPVIQREEITKSYISSCDMLLHLMNVSQSATQTDVAFIIDALLYQNVSKLIIVITRADTVSQSAVDEVIAYTKISITDELKRQNRESKLDVILDNIRFFAISGNMALLCRTESEKAEKEGLTLEQSGILALEEELNNTLFGANAQKSQLLIHSAQNQLLEVIREKKVVLDYRLALASKDKEALEKEWEDFLMFKEERLARVTALKEEVVYDQNRLKESIRSLLHFAHSEFYALQTVLRERVVSDVRYSYETTKKLPKESRLEVIVQTAFKDGIIDIVRDYRYKLFQNLEETDEKYILKYKRDALEKESLFDAESFFEDDFQTGFLTQNIDLSILKINKAVKNSKAKEISVLDTEMKHIVLEMFSPVELQTRERLKYLSLKFIDKLIAELAKTFMGIENKIAEQEKSLKAYLEKSTDLHSDDAQSSLVIHDIRKQLTEIENVLKG